MNNGDIISDKSRSTIGVAWTQSSGQLTEVPWSMIGSIISRDTADGSIQEGDLVVWSTDHKYLALIKGPDRPEEQIITPRGCVYLGFDRR